MDDNYDVIALGTGLKECILSGLMSSVAGKKVLHMDRNAFYGGETASLNLDQLFERFRPGEKAPASFGRSRDYCIDLCPKFIMACGDLVKILLKTKVTAYLDFQSVSGSFVFQNKLCRVPVTPKEALSSSLLGLFEKKYFRDFVIWVNDFEEDQPKTFGKCDPFVEGSTCQQLYSYWKLSENIQMFVGHAMALYTDDDYKTQKTENAAKKFPVLDLLKRIKLYGYSVNRYGNSPYIYPKWGLGGLPEGFSRRCAVHGGVYMLNVEKSDNFITKIVFDDDGRIDGVQGFFEGKEQLAKCKQLIADPSYFIGTDKIRKEGQIARCICILSNPIPKTNDVDSCQIIIPPSKSGRPHDTYVSMVSSVHNVCTAGKYVAVISTKLTAAEEKNPQQALSEALKIVGAVDDKFFWVSDFYVPYNNPAEDGCYITSSYDATTHFQTCTEEVMQYYHMLTGEPLDLTIQDDEEEEN